MSNPFSAVTGLKPRRSRFNLSYGKAFDCDMGQLIPTMTRYMYPGDIFDLKQELVARPIAPLRTSAFAQLDVHSYCFFVPLRLLFGTMSGSGLEANWEVNDHDFEKFITGGVSGNVTVSLPRWSLNPLDRPVVNDNWNGIPSGQTGSNADWPNVTTLENGKYSLWDYMGFPVGVKPTNSARPLDFYKRAYNLIYNEWFRDRNVMPPVNVASSDIVLNACWKKDYFTSMLPWPQRGNPIGIPISGTAPISLTLPAMAPVVSAEGTYVNNQLFIDSARQLGTRFNGSNYKYDGAGNNDSPFRPYFADLSGITGQADVSLAATFSVNDLRLAFQMQRWMEISAKVGSRYVEYLKGMYGTSPTDDTLQRPMFIGGSKSPIIISEVLQTSEGGSGVGTIAGHAISADGNKITRFRANEFGVMMTLMCIKPKAMYGQGIDRENLYKTRYDFLNLAFVNLGEQDVYAAELLTVDGNNTEDGTLNTDMKKIGFQGRYNELRTAYDQVCGGLRDQLSYWAMVRKFSAVPELNGQFLKCNPNKDLFVVKDEPAFVVYVNNKLIAYRPLPVEAQPGLIDHVYGERRR